MATLARDRYIFHSYSATYCEIRSTRMHHKCLTNSTARDNHERHFVRERRQRHDIKENLNISSIENILFCGLNYFHYKITNNGYRICSRRRWNITKRHNKKSTRTHHQDFEIKIGKGEVGGILVNLVHTLFQSFNNRSAREAQQAPPMSNQTCRSTPTS